MAENQDIALIQDMGGIETAVVNPQKKKKEIKALAQQMVDNGESIDPYNPDASRNNRRLNRFYKKALRENQEGVATVPQNLPLATRMNILQERDPARFRDYMQRLDKAAKEGDADSKQLLDEIFETGARDRRGYEGLATAMTAAPIAAVVLPNLAPIMSNPWVQSGFTLDGVRNAFTGNGVRKTYNHFKDGEYGRGTLSLSGDVLDIGVPGYQFLRGAKALSRIYRNTKDVATSLKAASTELPIFNLFNSKGDELARELLKAEIKTPKVPKTSIGDDATISVDGATNKMLEVPQNATNYLEEADRRLALDRLALAAVKDADPKYAKHTRELRRLVSENPHYYHLIKRIAAEEKNHKDALKRFIRERNTLNRGAFLSLDEYTGLDDPKFRSYVDRTLLRLEREKTWNGTNHPYSFTSRRDGRWYLGRRYLGDGDGFSRYTYPDMYASRRALEDGRWAWDVESSDYPDIGVRVAARLIRPLDFKGHPKTWYDKNDPFKGFVLRTSNSTPYKDSDITLTPFSDEVLGRKKRVFLDKDGEEAIKGLYDMKYHTEEPWSLVADGRNDIRDEDFEIIFDGPNGVMLPFEIYPHFKVVKKDEDFSPIWKAALKWNGTPEELGFNDLKIVPFGYKKGGKIIKKSKND